MKTYLLTVILSSFFSNPAFCADNKMDYDNPQPKIKVEEAGKTRTIPKTSMRLDLKERVQFHLQEHSENVIIFEYCKLGDCTAINPDGTDRKRLSEIHGIPDGAMQQLVMDAGTNSTPEKPINYGVIGELLTEKSARRAVCTDEFISDILTGQTRPEGYVIAYSFNHCTEITGPKGAAGKPLKQDVAQLKLKLSQLK